MRDFAAWLDSTALSQFIQVTGWVIPFLQSVHILMIGVVFVSLLVVVLRINGRVRTDQPFVAVWERFAPWLHYAVIIMVLTGILLVVGEPARQFFTTSFWLKMVLLAIGITSIVLFRRSLAPALAAGTEPTFTPGVRKTAMASLLIWLAIIFLGRAIAYDVEVWSSLSLALTF